MRYLPPLLPVPEKTLNIANNQPVLLTRIHYSTFNRRLAHERAQMRLRSRSPRIPEFAAHIISPRCEGKPIGTMPSMG